MSKNENNEELSKKDIDKVEKFASSNKTGVLVIFFDDIKGSTAMAEQMGDEAYRKRKKDFHDTPVEAIICQHKGQLIKSTGDGFMAVFTEPSTAVECALEIQEQFYDMSHLKVRIGMDMGQVRIEKIGGVHYDLISRHANRAARAQEMAEAGHILVTRGIFDDASVYIPKTRVSWKQHGFYRLKQGETPFELFEPYNSNYTQPMEKLRGTKAENEWTHCICCGIKVAEKDTFQCPKCGNSGICRENCHDAARQQCIRCTAKELPTGTDVRIESKKLADLKNPDAGFKIRVWSEKESGIPKSRDIKVVPKHEFSKYKKGDKVAVYFESTEDAHVYLFNIGPTGNISLIFPNEYSADNAVRAGKIYRFPDEKAAFEWTLDGPSGTEIIKAIAAKIPLDIWKFLDNLSSAHSQRDIRITAKDRTDISSEIWAEAMCSIVVQA
ncbi:MAG: DUF4384 domain-containing protein [Desulfococcaceae bacterium]